MNGRYIAQTSVTNIFMKKNVSVKKMGFSEIFPQNDVTPSCSVLFVHFTIKGVLVDLDVSTNRSSVTCS